MLYKLFRIVIFHKLYHLSNILQGFFCSLFFSHVSSSETCSYYGQLAIEILLPFHSQNTSVAFNKQLLGVSQQTFKAKIFNIATFILQWNQVNGIASYDCHLDHMIKRTKS